MHTDEGEKSQGLKNKVEQLTIMRMFLVQWSIFSSVRLVVLEQAE